MVVMDRNLKDSELIVHLDDEGYHLHWIDISWDVR